MDNFAKLVGKMPLFSPVSFKLTVFFYLEDDVTPLSNKGDLMISCGL